MTLPTYPTSHFRAARELLQATTARCQRIRRQRRRLSPTGVERALHCTVPATTIDSLLRGKP